MLTASPSPRLNPLPQNGPTDIFKPHSRFDRLSKSARVSSPIANNYPTHVYPAHQSDQRKSSQCTNKDCNHSNPTAPSIITPAPQSRPNMVDAGTQYSPPPGFSSPTSSVKTPAAHIARLQLADSSQAQPRQSHPTSSTTSNEVTNIADAAMPAGPFGAAQAAADTRHKEQEVSANLQHGKRQLPVTDIVAVKAPPSSVNEIQQMQEDVGGTDTNTQTPSKKLKADLPSNKIMPIQYEFCDTRDLVVLISSMLMELIRYNDAIPLRDGHLTRFHSRAPPGISVIDYLQRLTTHATLSPPIMLSMVYYIDRLCALYPAFTISSLTVHRFLITSATVASKGLSDSFWTNKTYAKVGGVSVRELALLELEFLVRVQWRIVPKPEVLVDYYRSLVERSPGYELEKPS